MPPIPAAPKLALALLLASGAALAQKPSPLAPPGAPQGGKPPALGAAPAPVAPIPVVPAPAPPPAARDTARTPPAAPPPQAVAPLPPPPADEDPAIRRLRASFGPTVQMAYRSATVLDSGTGSFRLDGVTLRRPNAEVTIEAVSIAGQREDGVQQAELRNLVSVEQGKPRITAARAQLAGLTIRRPAAPEQSITPDAVSFDRFSLQDLRVEDDTNVAIASLTVEEFGVGRPTRLRLENLSGENRSRSTAFTLARLAFSGLDIATLWTQVLTLGRPNPTPGRFEAMAETFTISEGGRPLGGADSLHIESETDAQLAGSGRATLRGLRLDGVPQLQEFLTRLGYQSLTSDITMEAGYQPQGGRMTMPSLMIAAPGFGSITLSMDVDGLDRDVPPETVVSRMRLLAMALRYRDEGLVPRALRMQAAQQQVNETQLREQIIGMAGVVLGGPAVAALREPIERFVRGQAQELEIMARPPQPLPLMSLSGQPPRNAEDAQRRFGLTATAR